MPRDKVDDVKDDEVWVVKIDDEIRVEDAEDFEGEDEKDDGKDDDCWQFVHE